MIDIGLASLKLQYQKLVKLKDGNDFFYYLNTFHTWHFANGRYVFQYNSEDFVKIQLYAKDSLVSFSPEEVSFYEKKANNFRVVTKLFTALNIEVGQQFFKQC